MGKKGGSGPSYKPQYTEPLERLMTSMAIGTATKANPNLFQVLQNDPKGHNMLGDFGAFGNSPQFGQSNQQNQNFSGGAKMRTDKDGRTRLMYDWEN